MVNVKLQSVDVTIDIATKLLKGLLDYFNNARKDQEICRVLQCAKHFCNDCPNIVPEYKNIRKRKVKRMAGEEALDESVLMTREEIF